MVRIDETTTLATVVDNCPELARELERLGLDYCCGGSRTLRDACVSAGLDPGSTLAKLTAEAKGGEPAEWASMAADVLVDHIEATHHRYLWDELPRVTAMLAKLVTVHGGRHPELVEVAATFARVKADLEPHMLKEERVLFPMIRDLASSQELPSFHCGSLRNPIAVMLGEHDVVGELLALLRRLTSGYAVPDDGCATYRACFEAMEAIDTDTHLHVHKENNVLFPMVVQMESERAGASA